MFSSQIGRDLVFIMLSTISKFNLWRFPDGWNFAKSISLNPFSIAQILARASPKAIVTEVEHVGAKFSGHASLSTEPSRYIVASWLKVELIFPVIAMLLIPLLLE